MAAMRAHLVEWQPGTSPVGKPAAWALVEAHLKNRLLARGIADDQGRIALIFPYPEPASPLFGSPPDFLASPPAGTRIPLGEQEWSVELEAAYTRHSAEDSISGDRIPELSEILSQPPATLWADSQAGQPLDPVKLKFGRELVVRSTDFTRSPPEGAPVLFITPAASPP
jgi:hypothetical protein